MSSGRFSHTTRHHNGVFHGLECGTMTQTNNISPGRMIGGEIFIAALGFLVASEVPDVEFSGSAVSHRVIIKGENWALHTTRHC